MKKLALACLVVSLSGIARADWTDLYDESVDELLERYKGAREIKK